MVARLGTKKVNKSERQRLESELPALRVELDVMRARSEIFAAAQQANAATLAVEMNNGKSSGSRHSATRRRAGTTVGDEAVSSSPRQHRSGSFAGGTRRRHRTNAAKDHNGRQ